MQFFPQHMGKSVKNRGSKVEKSTKLRILFTFHSVLKNFVENLFRDVKIKNYAIKCRLFGESVRIFMASPKDRLT